MGLQQPAEGPCASLYLGRMTTTFKFSLVSPAVLYPACLALSPNGGGGGGVGRFRHLRTFNRLDASLHKISSVKLTSLTDRVCVQLCGHPFFSLTFCIPTHWCRCLSYSVTSFSVALRALRHKKGAKNSCRKVQNCVDAIIPRQRSELLPSE